MKLDNTNNTRFLYILISPSEGCGFAKYFCVASFSATKTVVLMANGAAGKYFKMKDTSDSVVW